jgi:hypothetical protein
MIRDVRSSWIPDPYFSHPGSRIQGSIKHRVPDPQQMMGYQRGFCTKPLHVHLLVLIVIKKYQMFREMKKIVCTGPNTHIPNLAV